MVRLPRIFVSGGLAMIAMLSGTPSSAQEHEGHAAQADGHESRPQADEHESRSRPLGLPMSRDASGTAWQPDTTPMHGVGTMLGGWHLMAHWNVFVGYDAQGSERGDDEVTSVNWAMLMAEHPLLAGQLAARTMLSLEPLTVGADGYPLLLQTGETFEGRPLHDAQHPHDLFMEVAALYTTPITDHVGIQVYAAPAGEPALGPVAFPHRMSASSDPLAPLSHHWQDSSHISFGVLTAGVFTRFAKLEGSWFNGREPDEERYDFDLDWLDSASGRLTVNPVPSLSLQTSYGYLDEPEPHEPGTVHRITASASWTERLAGHGTVASTLAWGRNVPEDGDATDAFLLETNLDLGAPGAFFGRGEIVGKSGEDLALPDQLADRIFTVGSVDLGYVYSFPTVIGLIPGVGVRGSVNFIGDTLEEFYGTETPVGGMAFVRLQPMAMDMEGGEHGGQMQH
jgi:hypothetical protein